MKVGGREGGGRGEEDGGWRQIGNESGGGGKRKVGLMGRRQRQGRVRLIGRLKGEIKGGKGGRKGEIEGCRVMTENREMMGRH